MKTLSVVISAFNEEKNLPACLKSVSFADEIIVVDHESTDGTASLAKKHGAVVYSQPNNPAQIDMQKNFGFTKATCDWILSLDADERVPQALAEEIRQVIDSTGETAFRIPRKNIIFGKWIEHSLWWPDPQLRLFQRGKGSYTDANVHKTLQVDGTIGEITEPLIHENYQSITQYLSKMDTYTENEATAWVREGRAFSWIAAVRLPIQDFLKTFFLQEGYKDGFHGFVLSTLQGFYMFLVVCKVWEKQGFKEEAGKQMLPRLLIEWHRAQKEIHYWFLTARMDSSHPVKRTYYRLKRKYTARALKKE